MLGPQEATIPFTISSEPERWPFPDTDTGHEKGRERCQSLCSPSPPLQRHLTTDIQNKIIL
jgi:hypothetical protein